jgi:hypothetical protein
MTQKVVTNDEAVTGSKKFFLAIFGTFGRYITNLRGTFVENVKKSRKSTHPTVHCTGTCLNYCAIFKKMPIGCHLNSIGTGTGIGIDLTFRTICKGMPIDRHLYRVRRRCVR